MALTSGDKKGIVFLIIAALASGGGYYFVNHKPVPSLLLASVVDQAKPEAIKEPAVVIPVAPVVEKVEQAVKKHHVAKDTAKKKVHHSSESHGGSVQADIHREMSKDQEAPKGLAGGSL